MNTVVLDFERLKHPHCGLGQYCLHLGRALLAEAADAIEPVFFLPPGQEALFADRSPRCLAVRAWNKEVCYRVVRPLWRIVRGRPAYDLWHVTHQLSKYLPLDERIPVLLTIHDLNFLRGSSPARIGRKLRAVQAKVDRAAAVTTISEFVAGEVRQHLDLRGKPLHVVPQGVSPDIRRAKQRPDFLPDGPFLFTIGNALPHKNFHVLLEFLQRLPEYRLVIAGHRATPYGTMLQRRVSELGLTGRVSLPGPVGDAQRQWLYECCEAFVFPSLSEGFGLPVLEAMQCGRPVFLSRLTSLPEVGGSLAFYWDSFDADAMARVFRQGLAQFHADPGFAQRLQARAAQFSWSHTARAYLGIYREILGNA